MQAGAQLPGIHSKHFHFLQDLLSAFRSSWSYTRRELYLQWPNRALMDLECCRWDSEMAPRNTKIFRQHGMVHWNSLQKIPYKKNPCRFRIFAELQNLTQTLDYSLDLFTNIDIRIYIQCSNGLACFEHYQALRHGVEGPLSQPQPLPGRTTGASASQIQFTQFLDLAKIQSLSFVLSNLDLLGTWGRGYINLP